jgi:hypothetical protein
MNKWRTSVIYAAQRTCEHRTKAAAVRYARTLGVSVAIQRRRAQECATDWETVQIVGIKAS